MFRKKGKSKKLKTILMNIETLLIMGFFLFNYAKENYRINISESIPTGIYKIYSIEDIQKGDCIIFTTDENIRKFMVERGYIRENSKGFIKKVAGMEGDTVEIGDYLKINGKIIKKLPKKDSLGNPLPLKPEKYTLKKNEFFMLGDHERSFDSSYIGAIKKEQLLKKAELILEI